MGRFPVKSMVGTRKFPVGVPPLAIGAMPQFAISTGCNSRSKSTGTLGVTHGHRVRETLWSLSICNKNSMSLDAMFSNQFVGAKLDGLTLSHSLELFEIKVSFSTNIVEITSLNPTLLHNLMDQQLVRA